MAAGRQALGRHITDLECLCEPGRVSDRDIKLQIRTGQSQCLECSIRLGRDVTELPIEGELRQLAGVLQLGVDVQHARCNNWQPKVPEHSPDIRMREFQREIRAVQGVKLAQAAIDAELQPFDCSLYRHADVPPGEKRVDGTDVPINFRPVLVDPSLAGHCQQSVLAGFYGQGLEVRDTVRVARYAIGHLDIAEPCVPDDCGDLCGARVAR